MAYKALYRTYRPQNFNEVIGQETVVRALQNALRANKTTHAYLFSGPRGTGKTTMARILAKALNCSNLEDANPCCECTSCLEIAEGNNPNVIEIDAASNNGVDEIRDIREKAKFLPAGSKYKVYIIDEVHMLSTSAFNALLKILEEPPKHVVFILATTEAHKVLPTILSRCQRYDFLPFTISEIKETIKKACEKEVVSISDSALDAISASAEGGMRDAYSVLDQAIALGEGVVTEEDVHKVTGTMGVTKTFELVNAFENKDVEKCLKVCEELLNSGKEVNKIVVGLLEFYKELLVYKNLTTEKLGKLLYSYDEFKELASKIEINKIFFYVDILSDLQNKIRFSTTPQIYLEVAIIKMINVSSFDIDFSSRLTKLEQDVIAFQNSGSAVGEVNINANDLEKIKLLDDKIDNVIEQLNKMELPKWIVKVQEFEASSPNLFIKKINELINEISKVQEDVALLKVTQDGFQNKLENAGTMDASSALEKISELEDLIKKTKVNVNYNEIEDFVNRKLDYFEEEQEKEFEKIEQKMIEEVTHNATPEVEIKITSELEDRLKVLEENTYKLMSGAFKAQNNPGKKTKPVFINENQMVLFGEELVPTVENYTPNENVDFEEYAVEEESAVNEETVTIEKEKQEVLEENVQELIQPADYTEETDTLDTDVLEEESQIIDYKEEVSMNENEEINETEEEDSIEVTLAEEKDQKLVQPADYIEETDTAVVEEESQIADYKEEASMNENKETKEDKVVIVETEELEVQSLNPFEVSKEQTVKPKRKEKVDPNADLFSMYSNSLKEKEKEKEETVEKYQNPYVKRELSPAERALNESVASLGRRSTANSELVVGERKTTNNDIYFGAYNTPRQNLSDKPKEESVIIKDGYDVKILERILNDSRTDEGRNDKARITNLWKYIATLAPSDKRVIAEVLAEGVICAVGKNEFVISYPNSSICNQVMSKKFKRDSLKLLYDMLDSEYNYLALPDEVWHQKRTEYVNQYNIGIKYPKLTPFNNPELVIMEEVEEKSESDLMYEKAKALFGDSLETIEKEKK